MAKPAVEVVLRPAEEEFWQRGWYVKFGTTNIAALQNIVDYLFIYSLLFYYKSQNF